MTYRIIKYGLLGILIFLTVYQNFPIGDYCSGLVEALTFMFFCGLSILTFAIFLTIDLIKTFKRKRKFDYVILLFFGIFLTTNFLLLKIENKKFWTKTLLIGQIEVGDLRVPQLKLYDNQTFSASTSYADYSCTYQGDYLIENDTLILKRNELSELTNQLFFTKYLISISDSLLKPIDHEYRNIKIKNWEQ